MRFKRRKKRAVEKEENGKKKHSVSFNLGGTQHFLPTSIFPLKTKIVRKSHFCQFL